MKNITFINAGAGSGKTYRLTEELYNAVLNNECKANEVMLTTFTINAAEEIKTKAREKLLEKNLSGKANELENAFIGTVHAVGTRMIQKFWHYAGFPKEIRVMAEEDTTFYFNQAISTIPTEPELSKLQKLNFKFDPRSGNYYDPEKWKADLFKIIAAARSNSISDFKDSEDASLLMIEELLNTNHSETIEAYNIGQVVAGTIQFLTELPEKGNSGRKDKIPFLSGLNTGKLKYTDLIKLKDIFDDQIKKMQGLGTDPDRALTDLSKNLEGIYRLKNVYDDIKAYNTILFTLAKRSIDEYAIYKQEIGVIDYTDMEVGFLRLLDIQEVREEINNTIKLLLVDEFQDSSPIQLAIFIKLSEIVDRSIWVGDPKQSIYGFRGTDPELIASIIKEFKTGKVEGSKIDNLGDSWRSRPEIVNLVNGIFKAALKDQVHEEHIALNPVRSNQGFNGISSLHHFNLVEKKASNPLYYAAVAKSVVKLLNSKSWEVCDKNGSQPDKNSAKEKVAMRPLHPGDICILCKTNDAVEQISGELMARGVRVAAEKKGLEEKAEYKLIKSLLRLLISQYDSLAKAEIKLLTEAGLTTGGLIDERLEFINKLPALSEKPASEEYNSEHEYKAALEQYEREKNNYYILLNEWGKDNLLVEGLSGILSEIVEFPVPQILESLINRLNLYAVVAKWDHTGQRRANLQKVIEYAYKYDDRCLNMNLGASIPGFLHYLESMDNKTESAAKDVDAVNIVTYHRSKGLEWPVVLLADFQKDIDWGFIAREVFGIYVHSDKVDLSNILGNRNIHLLPWVFGAPQAKVSDNFQAHIEGLEHCRNARNRQHKELKRLMYVGMTRPRDYLITTGISGQKEYPWIDMVNGHNEWNFKQNTEGPEGKVDLFDSACETEVHKLEIPDDIKLEAVRANQYFKGKTVNADRVSIPYFISPSKVDPPKEGVIASVYADIQSRIPTGKSLEGRDDVLGNCLHDILYYVLGSKIKGRDTSTEKVVGLIQNFGLDGSLNATEILSSIDKLYHYIEAEFSPVNWFRELPIESEIDGQLYKGEIDILLETSDGYILIDYKSYQGSMSRVLDASTSNYAGKYAGQLETYSMLVKHVTEKPVLKKLIYYTVLGNLVEIIAN